MLWHLISSALVNACAVMLLALFVLAHPLKGMGDRFSRSVFEATAALSSEEATPLASAADGLE